MYSTVGGYRRTYQEKELPRVVSPRRPHFLAFRRLTLLGAVTASKPEVLGFLCEGRENSPGQIRKTDIRSQGGVESLELVVSQIVCLLVPVSPSPGEEQTGFPFVHLRGQLQQDQA